MVKDHLLENFSENDLAEPKLSHLHHARSQSAARRHRRHPQRHAASGQACWPSATPRGKKGEQPVPQPQVALVALDPHTGEIRALVGGRNYGESQLNHALAHRQPGSVFKPFVYAAAFDNAAEGFQPIVTPVTTVDDVPTTFEFDGKDYTPDNYGEEFYGTVTVRDALIHSLNVATVKVAEMIGYQRVVNLARQMGLGTNIQATPAVALGAYEMTPIDVAAGYTAFATNGMRAEPLYLRSVVLAERQASKNRGSVRTRPVLDPRVAFLTTSIMEDVINRGTGVTVRSHGLHAARRGQDRHFARRLVRRLHLESALRRLGRL